MCRRKRRDGAVGEAEGWGGERERCGVAFRLRIALRARCRELCAPAAGGEAAPWRDSERAAGLERGTVRPAARPRPRRGAVWPTRQSRRAAPEPPGAVRSAARALQRGWRAFAPSKVVAVAFNKRVPGNARW